MDVLAAIRTRRSIRAYTDEPVAEADIKEILTAAMYAPSGGDQQPWRFVVVDDPKLLEAIPTLHPHAAMAAKAPLAILVCADRAAEVKTSGYLPQDCAAAVQNMLLAAHALGLGAVWCSVHPKEDRQERFNRLFGLPEGVTAMALVVIGRPAQDVPQPERYDPKKVRRNRWQG